MTATDAAFQRLAKSKFRSRFRLSESDRKYIADKGMETIRRHCEDFIRTRLAPANPPNDISAAQAGRAQCALQPDAKARASKQTPMRGHPVFKAQHACACRSALAYARRVRAGSCDRFAARPSVSADQTTSSLAHLPTGREPPQGAVTPRLSVEMVEGSERDGYPARTPIPHRRLPDGVDWPPIQRLTRQKP